MPPLENILPTTIAPPAQEQWSGTRKDDASNAHRVDRQESKANVSRKVRFLSEDNTNNSNSNSNSNSNTHETERREWNRHQDDTADRHVDDDDDVSTLTDVFHGYDIEAPNRRQQQEEPEQRQPLTLDPLNDDTSFDKMLEDAYLPSDDCISPFGEGGFVPLPAYHQGCEDVVLQIGEIVDTVKNCRSSLFVPSNSSTNNNNVAPCEQTSFFAPLWEQARRFLNPTSPPPIPTVLSSENTMEIYPDSSISFAEAETLPAVPPPNIAEEMETVEYNPEQPDLSRRGLLDNVKERSSDYPSSDEATKTMPTTADQRKVFESTAIFDPSETSNASVSTNEDDIPRPYGQLRQRRRRYLVCFLIVLVITIVCAIGFGIMAGNKQGSERQQVEEKLETRLDPTATSWPMTASPSQTVEEESSATTATTTAMPTASALSQTESPSVTPSAAPSELSSSTPTVPQTKFPSAAPSAISFPTATPTHAEVPSSSPTLPATTAPTEAVTTTMPTINPIEAAKLLLPDYPDFRFIPWTNVTVSLQLLLQQLLGYNEAYWNLPGSINNNGVDFSTFWEAQSFSTIKSTASIEVLSAVASIGFQESQWDCWVNHYQNFTWAELESLSPVSVTINNGTNLLNETGNSIVFGSDLQMAMTTFGWTDSNWSTVERIQYFFPTTEQGLGARSAWDDLTVTEQAAATRICFTQELWDRIPLK